MKKIKRLLVSTPQGEAGILDHESRYVFNYVTSHRRCEVSLTMPIRAESYAATRLMPIFEMNKPEGYLLDRIRHKLAKEGGLNDMKLLALTGHNQIGRLQYHEPDSPHRSTPQPLSLDELLKQQSSQSLFEFLIATYLESGISGMQPKVMVPEAKQSPPKTKATVIHSDLIVKTSGEDYPHLAQNEFLCMEAAKRAGLAVPQFWLSEDGNLFVMKRFDLKNSIQLGFEDMTVLMAKSSDERYQGSYENIAKVLQLYGGGETITNKQNLFSYIALCVMVRNGDAHLKNFGLLYTEPSTTPSLAPLYDVVTTTVYDYINLRTGLSRVDRTMALKLNKDRRYPTRGELFRFGTDTCHVNKPQEIIDRIASSMTKTLSTHRHRIDKNLFERLSQEWDQGRISMEPTKIFTSRHARGDLLSRKK